MRTKSYSIGELARLSGTPVRRIRFYSDKGLLPPTARSEGNYRLYTDMDFARLELIRALRAAGVELSSIAQVIAQSLPLAEVLRVRLGLLEREISAQVRVATAIRATLSLPHPTEDDFRRVLTMATLSNAEMQTKIREYVDSICEGSTIDSKNRERMVSFCACEIPDNPTVEQVGIWKKIEILLEDEDLRRSSNISMKKIYNEFGGVSYRTHFPEMVAPLEAAWKSGTLADASHVQELARRLISFEAEMERVGEMTIIEQRIFQGECKRRGKSSRDLFDLCKTMNGEKPTEGGVWPSDGFWTWFHDVLIAHRDQALPDHAARA